MDDDELRRLLAAGLEALCVPHAEDVAHLLEQYRHELELWNPRLGLVAASGTELVVRHILDSVAALPVLRSGGAGPAIADVGSGAGLPGLVLACSMREWRVTLIERSARKCGFLRNAALALGLTNVQVCEQDVDRVNDHFDTVVFRALKPLSLRLTESVARIVAADGAAYAYKARRSVVEQEIAELAGLARVEVIPISVPFLDEERNLVRLSAFRSA